MNFDRNARVVFDETAADYATYRPGYPAQALEDMIESSAVDQGSQVLEIGCGTGQVTIPMAERGFQIDAVELGPKLAQVAAHSCARWPAVRVCVGAFESFVSPPEHYQLVYSAQAFHWIEPGLRLHKCAELLSRRGSLSLLYNYTRNADGVLELLSRQITRVTGGAMSQSDYRADIERWTEELGGCPLFSDLTIREYPWVQRYSAEQYVGLFRTYSDYRSLPERERDRVAEVIRHAVKEHGGQVRRPYLCVLFQCRKAD